MDNTAVGSNKDQKEKFIAKEMTNIASPEKKLPLSGILQLQGQLSADKGNLAFKRDRAMTDAHHDPSSPDEKKDGADLLTHLSMENADQRRIHNQLVVDAKNKSVLIDNLMVGRNGRKASGIGQTMLQNMQVAPKFSNVDHSSVMRGNDEMMSAKNAANISNIMREIRSQNKPKNLQESLKELEKELPNYIQRKDPDRSKVITILCLINLFANSAYSSIAPFYPYEAVKKGLPEETLGFIFAGYSISMFVFAPMFGAMLNKFGRKNVLILGCLCESIAMFCFGLFVLIESPVCYGIMSFLCRVIEGFGNGCLNSATSSIISFNYADNMGNLMGLTQTFTGLGMLAGPIFGSILYEAGGFKLPFFVTGALLFVLIFPIGFFLKNDKKKDDEQSQNSQYDEEIMQVENPLILSGELQVEFAPIEENARMPNKKITFFGVLC